MPIPCIGRRTVAWQRISCYAVRRCPGKARAGNCAMAGGVQPVMLRASGWLLFCVLLAMAATPGRACSCGPKTSGSPCLLLEELDAVFLGRAAQSIRMFGAGSSSAGTVFQVIETFKGNVPERTRVMVFSSFWPDLCFEPYSIGSVYLIQATRSPQGMLALLRKPFRGLIPTEAFRSSGIQDTMYISAMCHGSRTASRAERDIPMLRQWKAGDHGPCAKEVSVFRASYPHLR